MLATVKIFMGIFLTFIMVDLIWLGLVAKSFYLSQLSSLMRFANGQLSPNWFAGILVYVLFTIGILVFVLPKSQGSLSNACYYGALFGLVTYGIYDLTNLALLANWPLKIVLVDMIWGTALCSIGGLSAYYFSRYFLS